MLHDDQSTGKISCAIFGVEKEPVRQNTQCKFVILEIQTKNKWKRNKTKNNTEPYNVELMASNETTIMRSNL